MNTKKKTVVRIALVDFWAGCDKSEIIRCLFPNDFELIEDENNPDLKGKIKMTDGSLEKPGKWRARKRMLRSEWEKEWKNSLNLTG